MRDYRFRVYNPADCTMTYNVGLDRISEYADETLVKMLQTGLKDRNGTSIYEGDILTADFYPFQDEGKYNYNGVIEWIDEEASFYMTKVLVNKDKRGTLDGISQPIEQIEEFEVIGNIYDTPELFRVDNGEEVKG